MKRLICFFDGTWERADHPVYTSNIVKLKRAIPSKSPDGIHQISYYSQGYALDGGLLMQYVGAAIGFGLDGEIRDTYRFLAQNYSPGDEIYIYGYSRGAFQARSLASFITLCGLVDSENLHLLTRAWDCYMKSAGQEEDKNCADIRAAGDYPVPIQCLGVYDTVGNLGVPGGLLASAFNRRFQFHNTGLHPSIKVGLHALAIDEFRAAFRPSLWTHPEGSVLPKDQIIEQVWFPGTHGDVGGGFADASLSDGALRWMAERTQTHANLAFNTDHLEQTTAPNALGPQNRVSGPLYHFDRMFPFVRVVNGVDDVVSRMRRKIFRRWRIGKVPPKTVPINEDIHDSAIKRFGKSVAVIAGGERTQTIYRPANLMAVIRRQAETIRSERVDGAATAPIVLKRRQILEIAESEEANALLGSSEPVELPPEQQVQEPLQLEPTPTSNEQPDSVPVEPPKPASEPAQEPTPVPAHASAAATVPTVSPSEIVAQEHVTEHVARPVTQADASIGAQSPVPQEPPSEPNSINPSPQPVKLGSGPVRAR